ncbi:hypothetical protein KIN20_012545 [Parelaphostrongylus tenuis]|uniref:long-chain-fatty-acid--CoA ligase n=1 Tax=Parelaphostrongylus tenuis TaxID=148309 RepID=A0AAD5MUW1_PARTN|nr:hypothetical protein KIN20_012545 [Parelaphostrongylus tenuis]
MADTPSDALWRIAAFAIIMLLSGRDRWWIVFILYSVYRLTSIELFKRIRLTARRDLTGLLLLFQVKLDFNRRLRANRPLHEIFLEQVRKNPEKLACIEVETGRQVTYDELNKLMNKYVNYFCNIGYKKGDVVSLFYGKLYRLFRYMARSVKGRHNIIVHKFKFETRNRWPIRFLFPIADVSLQLQHFSKFCISLWLFLVYNSSILALKWSCRGSKFTFYAYTNGAQEKSLREAMSIGSLNISDSEVYVTNSSGIGGPKSLSAEIKEVDVVEPVCHDVNFQDVLCYIYTSGTTGNPKPAVIKHFRYYFMAMGSGRSFGIRENDVIYITMPMYHSAAGIMGIGSLIVFGTSAVIRRKFSASNFWKDCVKYRCTASQYIGEICRYLLAQKPCDEEKLHNVRLMWGNGLRAEIWKDFVSRFRIQRIGELYGSTEGNSNIVNIDNHVGSCGFFPIYPFIGFLYPVRLIKVDRETGDLVRDSNGLCVPCRPGDTQKKIYRDVFAHGDQVFSSGDILYWDELGYLYFRDRRGDTFRWKGENVSTTEVEGILQPLMSVVDATVYGVRVGKHEGRAGMAAVVLKDGVDVHTFLDEIAKRLTDNLASYAIPVFIRLCKEIDRTGTFKIKKIDLQRQGFDLVLCNGDPIYYWNSYVKVIRYWILKCKRIS